MYSGDRRMTSNGRMFEGFTALKLKAFDGENCVLLLMDIERVLRSAKPPTGLLRPRGIAALVARMADDDEGDGDNDHEPRNNLGDNVQSARSPATSSA